MSDFFEQLERLRSQNQRMIDFAEHTGIPSSHQTYPDKLFEAFEEQVPAFIVEAFGIKKFPKRVYFNLLGPKLGRIIPDPTDTLCSFGYGKGKQIAFLARWDEHHDGKGSFQLSFETIFGPEKSRRHRWIKGYMIHLFRQGAFTPETLLQMGDELSNQFESVTGLNLEEGKTFIYAFDQKFPKYQSDGLQIHSGDMIGPDAFGTTLRFSTKIRLGASRPYEITDLVPLENQSRFKWDEYIVESKIRERYLEAPQKGPLAIAGLSSQITWSKYWSAYLPDLLLTFWTDKKLTLDDQFRLTERLADEVFAIVKSELGSILTSANFETLQDDIPTERFAIEKIESDKDRLLVLLMNGFVNYWGGIESVGGLFYRCNLDFSSSYLNDKVIECWVRALDTLEPEIGIKRIHVGDW